MKTLCTSLFLLLYVVGVGAQVDPPQVVSTAFLAKFPTARSVVWEAETTSIYEADFKMNGRKLSAAFDETGKWLETETTIKKSALPAAVKEVVAREFAGYEIEEAEKLETPDGLAYEVELEKEEDGKELETEVLFSAEGKLLKKRTEPDEEEDDK